MTVPPLDAQLKQRADSDLGDDPEDEAQGDPDGDGGTPASNEGSKMSSPGTQHLSSGPYPSHSTRY